MSIQCGTCGAPLTHIDAICERCLPGGVRDPGIFTHHYDHDPLGDSMALDAMHEEASRQAKRADRAEEEVERLRGDLAAAYRALADYQADIDQGFLPGSIADQHRLTVAAARCFVATGSFGTEETESGAPLFERPQPAASIPCPTCGGHYPERLTCCECYSTGRVPAKTEGGER